MSGKEWLVRVKGPWACWTAPEFRSERVSNPIPSQDGWVGVLRSILGHPSMNWFISQAFLLKEPSYENVTGNEMKFGTKKSLNPKDLSHTQRTTRFLRNPDYLIKAHISLSNRAGKDDNLPKFDTMFYDRITKGKQRRHVYLGLKECMAEVDLAETMIPPAAVTQSLGITHYGVDQEDSSKPRYFAPLTIINGVCSYPTWEEVRAMGIRKDL